jgi:thiamine-monophosphate kinase
MVPRAGYETVLTCDWFLEGTHFLREKHSPDSVGWKCLARAVSDIAAMGGDPRCFLLSLALPKSLAGKWFDQFLRGLQRAARSFRCELAGGDTTRRDEVLINITVVGEIKKGRAILRSAAKPGHAIFVSGRLGEAAAGLQIVRTVGSKSADSPALQRHLYPEPRLALGQWLAEKKLPSAMMDISDGLSSDLARLCGASDVGATIESLAIPLAGTTRDRSEAERREQLNRALHGGDDYELLFTVPPSRIWRVPALFQGISLSRVGEISSGHKLQIVDFARRKQVLAPRGWDPFRN